MLDQEQYGRGEGGGMYEAGGSKAEGVVSKRMAVRAAAWRDGWWRGL